MGSDDFPRAQATAGSNVPAASAGFSITPVGFVLTPNHQTFSLFVSRRLSLSPPCFPFPWLPSVRYLNSPRPGKRIEADGVYATFQLSVSHCAVSFLLFLVMCARLMFSDAVIDVQEVGLREFALLQFTLEFASFTLRGGGEAVGLPS